MKAFVCTVVIPNDWTATDVVTAINLGIRQQANETGKELPGISYSAMVQTSFDLKRQDL
jgi:hypothetical protein